MPSPHNRDGVPPVCSILCGRAGRTADNDVPLRPGGDMSRPQSEAEYLARMVPPSVAALRRRMFLKGVAGTGAFGSNEAGGDVPQKRRQALVEAYQESSGLTIEMNEVDHNTFQENINNYLQGSPDDVFGWFAGYRMRFFAERGLVGDVSDVWKNITGMSDALKKASTGADGKQYFVPITNYPWAVFYRKSVFKDKGYEVPKTLDDLNALGAQMKKDGLVPIAFGDKDGWPAM